MKMNIGIFLMSLLSFSITYGDELPVQLHIGKQQDYPPYIYSKDGKTIGVCTELAEEAFKMMGITVEYTQYPFSRMLEMGKSGEVDAVMLVFKTKERETFLYYPEHSLHYEENSFFTKKNTVITYNGSVQDLKDQIIGVVRGFSYGDEFDKATSIKRDFCVDDAELVKKLDADRFKIGIGSKYVITYQAEKKGILNDIKFLEPNLFDQNPLYIGFSKAKPGYDKLTVKFTEALASMKQSGKYQSILKKYNVE